MTAREYENLISRLMAEIFQQTDNNSGITVCFGAKNKYRGASGHPHQIDVSVQSYDQLYLVECKCWESKVKVETVLAFYGRITDIRPTIGGELQSAIATRRGYQPGAEVVAKHFGIELWWVQSEFEFGMKFKDRFLVRAQELIKVSEQVSVELSA